MECKICGKPSGFFPLCKSCNEKKDEGKIIKDEEGDWISKETEDEKKKLCILCGKEAKYDLCYTCYSDKNKVRSELEAGVHSYDENNKIISSSIIEVKCRWFRNIYNESTPTDVLKQLRDYYQFRFKEKDENNINRRFSIDNMICVFPFDNENDYLYDDYEHIHYIPLDLNKNFRNLDGYKKIEEILDV